MAIKILAEETDIADFLACWGKCYDEGKYSDEKYKQALNLNGLLEKDGIQYLFEWKNGGNLSAKKQHIVDSAKTKISILNEFRKKSRVTELDFDEVWDFASSIIDSGIVYKVYLAHISRPADFPLVDQHVLRAWNYLKTKRIEEIDQNKQVYLEYRKFVLGIQKQSGKSLREIDQAMMAFGQFLNSQFNAVLKA
jgi:hypothetical protein